MLLATSVGKGLSEPPSRSESRGQRRDDSLDLHGDRLDVGIGIFEELEGDEY